MIDKRASTGLKYFDNSVFFIEYSSDINDVYKNIEEYNSNKYCKIIIVFINMIADMLNNKKA